MNEVEQRNAAKHFAEYWKGKGYEKGESQKFWLSLLRDVCGVEHPEEFISFEDQVHLDHTSFIDGYIPSTHVLIEQKGLGKNLRSSIPQSDGTKLKPIQQAQRYASALPYSQRPRWIVICNFERFHIYDMEHPQSDPVELLLSELPQKYYLLDFLTRTEDMRLVQEMEISIQAGELVGKLYDALLKQYRNPEDEHALRSLNALCVRLVFCLYAEDAGIFGHKQMFHDYLLHRGEKGARRALIELFRVLDQTQEQRDPYLADDDPELAAFPYVNGGLFRDEDIEIPAITGEIYRLLLSQASEDFDWSDISPTIFGAVFESTLNPETRRKGGMHYTSIENIHKVIDPLFLDDLKAELAEIKAVPVKKTREQRLRAYQDKLASLKFLDPAAGSGNFLTESYLCLRKLENEVIEQLYGAQIVMGLARNPIKVSISQFYGIEINDFAVSVATTALWIAESQMLRRTEDIVHMPLDFLPLKTNAYIREGNALRIDWNEVVPKEELNYIMGNPPFVGKKYQSKAQKDDMLYVFGSKYKGVGNLDYVTAWYRKASEYIHDSQIEVAFVSTSSITQGEHLPLFWKKLYEDFPVNIVFAYKSFVWNSESKEKAAVHCVIIGFVIGRYSKQRWLFTNDIAKTANNIHPYLIDMENIFIENRSKPLANCSPLVYGSFALDDGNYTISEDEYIQIIQSEPEIAKYIKPFIGSEEFINGKKRYCVWLKNADIREVKKSKILSQKVLRVQIWRSKSGRKETVAAANSPMLFAEIRQPSSNYLAIPITSSERRIYIPMGYMSKDIIASNHLLVLPEATLFEFGVLISNVHMAWMRTVAGRLKSDYNYSARIVYNNFPWCCPTPSQKVRIEETAQAILNARDRYPQYTLADMYDPLYMPADLLTAHQANDRAVMEAYGMPVKGTTESSCVAELMRRYQELTR